MLAVDEKPARRSGYHFTRGDTVGNFTAKINKTESCWLWQGGKDGRGYGQFRLNGRVTAAHRAAYLLFVGEIPPDTCVCHRCDIPQCVNPEHLFLGTPRDNSDDKMNKGRHRMPDGETKPFIERRRQAILMRLRGDDFGVIGQSLGVSPQRARAIVRRFAPGLR